jgi:prevent-host-death family protein
MDKESSFQEAPLPFKHVDGELSASSAGICEVSVKEAKAKLTELLRRAEAGERIVLTRHGKPVADLVPHAEGSAGGMSLLDRIALWRKDHPPTGIGYRLDRSRLRRSVARGFPSAALA